jgi:hypothetical protein
MQRWSHQFCTLSLHFLSLSLSLPSCLAHGRRQRLAEQFIAGPAAAAPIMGITEKLKHIDHATHILLFYGLVGRGNLGLEPGYQAALIQVCSQQQFQSITTSCVGKQKRFQWILISLQK